MKPLVSVVMPVYNAERYVAEAIESILQQTFEEFEFLIINDGSTDGSLSIIKQYADQRIKVICNNENKGLVYSLNVGLEKAGGEFVARMDADDIALPERFSRQVNFLKQNPGVGVCGTWALRFNENSAVPGQIWKTAERHDDVIRLGLKRCPIIHPTAMFRMEIVKRYNLSYHQQWYPADDYQFWFQFSKYSQLSNLKEVLLHYRDHGKNMSTNNTRMGMKAAEIRTNEMLNYFGVSASEPERDVLFKFISKQKLLTSEYVPLDNLLLKILDSNKIPGRYLFALELIKSHYENYMYQNIPRELKDFKLLKNQSIRLLNRSTILRYIINYFIKINKL